MAPWHKKTLRSSYRPVSVETLHAGTRLPFDIYLKIDGQIAIFRRAGVVLDARQIRTLMDHRVEAVLVAGVSGHRYQEYAEEHIWDVAIRSDIPLHRRAEIVYQVALSLMDDAFSLSPPKNIWERARRVAGHMARLLLEKPTVLTEFSAVSSHDYSLSAHAVNVCFMSVALGLRIGIDRPEELEDLSAGALLHDIGQSRISRRILLKRGPLTQEEYELIKRAPEWGVEILRETGAFRADVFFPVLQHQERMDGSGYPAGLKGSDIHIYGRICAITEAFDSITLRHVYREAMDGFPALVIIRRNAVKFDPILVDAFIGLLKRKDAAVILPSAVPAR